MILPQTIIDKLIAHAKEENPNECCGIVAGKNEEATRVYRMTNTEKSPFRYRMDSKEQFNVQREIDEQEMKILAYYHSHTHTEAYPSATDIRMAIWNDTKEAIWPEVSYILISLMDNDYPQIKTFRILDGGKVVEVNFQTDTTIS
jgi:proteasome lid subunit RPN8/RPN11